MSPLRKLARETARNKSYQQTHTTDMFQYFFTKLWREKGHPASNNLRPTKKPFRFKKRKKC